MISTSRYAGGLSGGRALAALLTACITERFDRRANRPVSPEARPDLPRS